MRVYEELTLRDFNAWCGAVETKEAILEQGLEEDFERLIEELYPDGLSDTELNDILWFEDSWLFEMLGIDEEEEEE